MDEQKEPIIAASRDGHVILLNEEDVYGLREISERRLRLRIKEAHLENIIPLETERGRTLTSGEIIEVCGTSFEQTIRAFGKRRTEYDPSNGGTVTIGYPVPRVKAKHDPRVDAWLRSLAGDDYARLETWIASCAQCNIDRLAATLVIVGPADIGKSLLAKAVAGLWGEADPPKAELLTARFNGDLARCPIVFDDEAQMFGSRELSTKRFRDLAQSTERMVERKGKERSKLTGALRLVVACNGLGDLRFADVTGPDVVDAVRDRLLVIDAKPRTDACREALAALRIAGLWEVDVDAIIAHMAWIAAELELPAERFLGAGGSDAAGRAVLAALVEAHSEVWDALHAWIERGGGVIWFSVADGRLCVDLAELAAALKWDAAKARAALAPFVTGRVKIRVGDHRPRLLELDAVRVVAATQLDGLALVKRMAAEERDTGRFRSPRVARN